MKIKRRLSLVAGLITLTIASAARAQSITENTGKKGPAEDFSAKGQIAISSDAAITTERQTISGVEGGTTTILLAPAADLFVFDNLSVGGFVGISYTRSGNNDSNRLSLGPRVGYNIPFSDLISIWPKIGFSYAHTNVASASSDAFAINLFAPIMFHPVRHFFAGFGPFLDTDLTGDNRATAFGGRLTVGGWM